MNCQEIDVIINLTELVDQIEEELQRVSHGFTVSLCDLHIFKQAVVAGEGDGVQATHHVFK